MKIKFKQPFVLSYGQGPLNRKDSDPDSIKKQYVDADEIKRQFSISSFPTYLFFSPDGKIVHRILGLVKDGHEFVAGAEDALDPARQYYTFLTELSSHKGDSAFLRSALKISLAQSDDGNSLKIGDEYIDCLKDPYLKVNLELLIRTIKSTQDKAFGLVLENPRKVNQVFGKDFADDFIRSIIFREMIYPHFTDERSIRWSLLYRQIQSKYPGFAYRTILQYKPQYYAYKSLWHKYDNAIIKFMKLFKDSLDDYTVNNVAWGVFKHSGNKLTLALALSWSRRTVKSFPGVDPQNVDTYANLLFKLGETRSAVEWETQALSIAKSESDRRTFEV